MTKLNAKQALPTSPMVRSSWLLQAGTDIIMHARAPRSVIIHVILLLALPLVPDASVLQLFQITKVANFLQVYGHFDANTCCRVLTAITLTSATCELQVDMTPSLRHLDVLHRRVLDAKKSASC